MDNKEKKFKKIMGHYRKAMNRFSKLEQIPMDFGSGDVLYRSEIHTIEMIGLHPDSNLTELAARLEVTKGTLSQLINKLSAKDLVLKTKGERNDKEVTLKLTPKGRMAFDGHHRFHNKMYLSFMDICQDLSLEELEMFEDLLLKIMDNIEREISRATSK